MASLARIDIPGSLPLDEELAQRIAQLDRDFRLLSVGELCRRADAIRQIARAHGREPLARLAGGLGAALAREGRGAAFRPWLDGMRDVLLLDAGDEETARAVLAAVSVRLAH